MEENGIPKGRVPQMVIQYQMTSPENIRIQVTLHGLRRLDLHIQEYTHVHLSTHTYGYM